MFIVVNVVKNLDAMRIVLYVMELIRMHIVRIVVNVKHNLNQPTPIVINVITLVVSME